jgi:hypothetical protein
MCIEVFNKYGCGCQESIDLLFCPSLQEIHHLVDFEGVSELRNTETELYEQCKGKSAERFVWRMVSCDSCGLVVTAEQRAELILKDLYDADNAADGDNDLYRTLRVIRVRKCRLEVSRITRLTMVVLKKVKNMVKMSALVMKPNSGQKKKRKRDITRTHFRRRHRALYPPSLLQEFEEAQPQL